MEVLVIDAEGPSALQKTRLVTLFSAEGSGSPNGDGAAEVGTSAAASPAALQPRGGCVLYTLALTVTYTALKTWLNNYTPNNI